MDIDPMKALQTLHKSGDEYAKAKGARVLLEESLKSVRAECMLRSQSQSAAGQERDALASREYRSAVEAYAYAVETEERLRRKLAAAEAAIELWRSQEASNRRMDRAAQ